MPSWQWLPDTLVQAMDRVEAELDLAWSLEAVASTASFSPFHFHRRFRAATSETPAAFIERLRLERAALLLLAHETSITDLSLDVGFRNPETFARRFRARFGVSARDYRRHQIEAWRVLGLEAGRDPMPGPGRIELCELALPALEVRRRMGEEEPFDFSAEDSPWRDGLDGPDGLDGLEAGSELQRFGILLDWPGITEAGKVRQDWARSLDGRAVSPGWVRRTDLDGLYATLKVPGSGPVPNTIYQRLFVWALGGRHRLRPGPIIEMRGVTPDRDAVVVCQPVDNREERATCSSTRSRSTSR